MGPGNVRGLLPMDKLTMVEKETHRRRSGHLISRNNNTIIYSRTKDTSRKGVAIIINKKCSHAINESTENNR